MKLLLLMVSGVAIASCPKAGLYKNQCQITMTDAWINGTSNWDVKLILYVAT